MTGKRANDGRKAWADTDRSGTEVSRGAWTASRAPGILVRDGIGIDARATLLRADEAGEAARVRTSAYRVALATMAATSPSDPRSAAAAMRDSARGVMRDVAAMTSEAVAAMTSEAVAEASTAPRA